MPKAWVTVTQGSDAAFERSIHDWHWAHNDPRRSAAATPDDPLRAQGPSTALDKCLDTDPQSLTSDDRQRLEARLQALPSTIDRAPAI